MGGLGNSAVTLFVVMPADDACLTRLYKITAVTIQDYRAVTIQEYRAVTIQEERAVNTKTVRAAQKTCTC